MLSNEQKKLVEALRTNSRKKLTELSEQLKVPLSTVHDRLYRLVNRHNIRLVSIPDFKALQMPLRAWIFLSTKQREQAREFLSASLNSNTLLAVNNGADFACECVFKDFKQYDDFLQECMRFGEVKHHPIIEVVCQETAQLLSS